MKAKEISAAIIKHYGDRREWAVIEELRVGTGFGNWSEKSIDLFVLNCWPSKANHKIAFEIKVSRSDFLSELKRPIKRHPALMISDQFYFATPKGLVVPAEIPLEAGLMEIDEAGAAHFTLKAPMREAYPPTWPLVASIARRLNKWERACQH